MSVKMYYKLSTTGKRGQGNIDKVLSVKSIISQIYNMY